MLIPSIDLQGGRIVQLVQGEKLAIEATDPEVWITRFSGFPRVQLIDLDAAKAALAWNPRGRRKGGREGLNRQRWGVRDWPKRPHLRHPRVKQSRSDVAETLGSMP